jgi:hypothetical protein
MIIFRGKSFSIMFFSNYLIISFQSCSLCSLLAVIYKSHYQETFTLHFIHPPTYNSLSLLIVLCFYTYQKFLIVYLGSSFCLSIFLPVSITVYLCRSLSLSVSLSLCFSLSLFLCLSF